MRGGWVRGWLPEHGDCSQMWAEPLRKELRSTAPESTSSAPHPSHPCPAPEAGWDKRNWRQWLSQSPGQGGQSLAAARAAGGLSAISLQP